MAVKDSKKLKTFLIIFGSYIIIEGAFIIFNTCLNWDYLARLQYPWHPGYFIGVGIGVFIIGLSVLLASREPAKHIKVIDGMIIFNILVIVFICLGLHMLGAFDISFRDPGGTIHSFSLFSFDFVILFYWLPIIFLIIFISHHPKKAYKEGETVAAKDLKTLKAFLIISGIMLIIGGAAIIFPTISKWDYLGGLQYPWHPAYVIGTGIAVLLIGLSALLASRNPANHIKVIDGMIIFNILMIIFISVVLHMSGTLDISFGEPCGIFAFFSLLPLYLVIPYSINHLSILFLIILAALRPKKSYIEGETMAANDSKTLKAFPIICGILLIIGGAAIIFLTLNKWHYLGGRLYQWYPKYVIGAGIGIFIIGLSVLLTSREPVKHITVINLMIIFNILMIIFFCVEICVKSHLSVYFSEGSELVHPENIPITLAFYNILPINFLFILIRLRPKKAQFKKQQSN